MADLSITPGSVVPDAGATLRLYTAGVTITAGQLVYIDTAASNVLKLADANASSATAIIAGLAIDNASLGQPCIIMLAGDIDLGVTLTVAGIYILSATAGGICPSTDLASASYLSILGVATAADNLKFSIFNSGAQKP